MDKTKQIIPLNSSKNKFKIVLLLTTASLLILTSWACTWFPLDWSQWDFGKTPEENSQGEQNHSGQWDVSRCNALKEVEIDQGEFLEENFENSDGSPGGIDCSFSYQVTNTSEESLILIYYDHFSYGENPPPNEYEFGWQKTAPIQPGESWQLRSMLSSTPKQPLYMDLIYSLAVIYDSPDCAWLTTGGVQQEILEIAVEDPLLAPCQAIDPGLGPQSAPNLRQGLIGD